MILIKLRFITLYLQLIKMSIYRIQTHLNSFNYINNKLTLSYLVHDHPTIVKTMQIAAIVLGALAIITAIAFPPIAVAAGIIGTAALPASACTLLFLHYGTCAKHDMKNHAYQEAAYGKSGLYYFRNIPIREPGW